MTVTYTGEVVTSRGTSVFLKLLFRWKGSIYKIIWRDLIIFLALYYAVNLTYRFALDDDSQKLFIKIVMYCREYYSLIPLAFVLGFFVTLVTNRWWSQYTSIPFPDNIALLLSGSVQKQDEQSLLVRKSIIRYICLAFAITMSLISPRAKKRFPTLDHFIESGLMMRDEKKIFEDMENEYPGFAKYWLPLAWAANIITRARHEGLITSDVSVRGLLEELNIFRGKCGTLLDYDWISIPLVYTQVVTLAVYSYFLTTLLAQQYIEPDKDLYFPFLAVLEYFFYMGWLKVAETLINPFGDDDDDFEVNWLIDRNVLISYLLVDKMHHEHPKLMKDQYWGKVPQNLPYTIAADQYLHECPKPSTEKITVKKGDSEILEGSRRNTRENVDGTMIRNESILRRLFRSNRPAKRIHRPVHSNDEVVEMNNAMLFSTMSTPNPTIVSNESNNNDFESLKRQRLDEMKRKIKKVLSLLNAKNLKEEDEDKLLEEIIYTTVNKME